MKKMMKKYWFVYLVIGLMAFTSGLLMSTANIMPTVKSMVKDTVPSFTEISNQVQAIDKKNKGQTIIIRNRQSSNSQNSTIELNTARGQISVTDSSSDDIRFDKSNKEASVVENIKNKIMRQKTPGTMEINGVVYQLSQTFNDANKAQQYIDANQHSNIAIEWGNLDVNSGQGVKIAGHAPGIFGALVGKVKEGTTIKLVDFSGNQKTYKVKGFIIHPQGEPSSDSVNNLYARVQQNESVVLQFCVDDMNYLYYAE